MSDDYYLALDEFLAEKGYYYQDTDGVKKYVYRDDDLDDYYAGKHFKDCPIGNPYPMQYYPITPKTTFAQRLK